MPAASCRTSVGFQPWTHCRQHSANRMLHRREIRCAGPCAGRLGADSMAKRAPCAAKRRGLALTRAEIRCRRNHSNYNVRQSRCCRSESCGAAQAASPVQGIVPRMFAGRGRPLAAAWISPCAVETLSAASPTRRGRPGGVPSAIAAQRQVPLMAEPSRHDRASGAPRAPCQRGRQQTSGLGRVVTAGKADGRASVGPAAESSGRVGPGG